VEDNEILDRALAMFCTTIKLTIDNGRAMGSTDTEILNVLYDASCDRIKGFEDECLELSNQAKRMMQ